MKRAVNKADPLGLLRAGAPDDEYDPEIDEIACRLPEPQRQTVAQTHTMVHQVFVKWFGTHAGSRGSYRKLAMELHVLRPRRARRRAKPVKQLTVHEAMRLAREVMRNHGETLHKLAK